MPPPEAAEALLVFGRFRLSPRRRELRADDVPVALGSRAFDLLLALLEASGNLVTKDELLRRVWPGTVVEENNLQVQISALRRVLGAERSFIRTVSGRGYRFAAEVMAADDEPPEAAPPAPPSPPAAPDAAAARPDSNLPVAISDFIGRESELEEVLDLAAAHRLVTLIGAGGIGKTQLGLAAARRLRANFPDGVWLAELAPLTDPLLVPVTVAAALGLELDATQVSPDRIASALGPKRLLLVLDNCEHVIDAAARIAEALLRGGSGLRVLATSREGLGAEGETIYRVPPLDLPPDDVSGAEVLHHGAVRLFVARVRAADPQFVLDERAAVAAAAVVRRLDGIPLAIELAAARAAALGIEGLAARLDDRFRLLTGGRRTALRRQQTLRATLDWSHDLLTEAERIVLRRLAIFSGGFTLAAACAVAAGGGIAAEDVVDRVAALVGKSLLSGIVGGPYRRYRLLETTRAYARERLAESGELDAMARRHAEYSRAVFEAAAETWGTMPAAEWLALQRPRIDNLRAALDWCFGEGGDPSIGIPLAAAAIPIWLQLSLLGECRRQAARALAALDAGAARDTRPEMLLQGALGLSLVYTRGPSEETGRAWSRALELAERLGDSEHRLWGLYGLWLYRIVGSQYRVALDLAQEFRRAAEIATLIPAALPLADRMTGIALQYMGDHAGARTHLERMLAREAPMPLRTTLAARLGVDQRVGTLTLLARGLWVEGFPDQAWRTGEAAVVEATEIDHANSICLALADGTGVIAAWNGDLAATEAAASRLLERAIKHALDVWHFYGTALRGWLATRSGDPASGVRLIRAAIEGIRETPMDVRYTMYLGWFAEALSDAGQIAAGRATIDEALARCERTDERWCLPELLRLRGELQRAAADPGGEAEASFHEALALARRQGALSWELRAALSLARLWRDQGRGAAVPAMLAPIRGRFVEGFGTADLIAADRLIAAAS